MNEVIRPGRGGARPGAGRPPQRQISPDHLGRAVFAEFRRAAELAADNGLDAADIVRSLWPDDKQTLRLITRADTAPSNTSGWVSTSADPVVLEFLRGLPSAAAALISRGLSLPIGSRALLPRQASGAVVAPWTTEGDPIAVIGDGLDAVEFPQPKKLGVIFCATRELAKKPAAQAVLDAVLRESAARSLDSAVFGTQAASDAALAGLLNATHATDLGVGTILIEDIANVGHSVASGLAPPLFVLSPGNLIKASLALPLAAANFVASTAIADSTLVAVDPSAFVFSVGAPDIFASREVVAHMSTIPLPIVSGVPVTADPTASAYQADLVLTRLLLDIAYVARRAGAVAKMTISWL